MDTAWACCTYNWLGLLGVHANGGAFAGQATGEDLVAPPIKALAEIEDAVHETQETWVIRLGVKAQKLGRNLQSEVHLCLSIERDVKGLTVTSPKTHRQKQVSDVSCDFSVVFIGAEPAVLCQLEPDKLIDAGLDQRSDPSASALDVLSTFHLSAYAGNDVS